MSSSMLTAETKIKRVTRYGVSISRVTAGTPESEYLAFIIKAIEILGHTPKWPSQAAIKKQIESMENISLDAAIFRRAFKIGEQWNVLAKDGARFKLGSNRLEIIDGIPVNPVKLVA